MRKLEQIIDRIAPVIVLAAWLYLAMHIFCAVITK